MPEFLAETYTPCAASDITAVAADYLALAMEQASEETVRFLGAIVISEDETCFVLYQASSADAVRAAATRAGLEPDRITPAVSIGWVASPTSMPAAWSKPPAAGLGADDPSFPEEI
jgi:hypothetical protein